MGNREKSSEIWQQHNRVSSVSPPDCSSSPHNTSVRMACTDVSTQPHRTWLSSSDSNGQESSTSSANSMPGVQGDKLNDWDWALALEIRGKLQDMAADGIDSRDAWFQRYSHLDIRKIVPRDADGELFSIGSAKHMLEPMGHQCNPCQPHRQNKKCYRKELC